jgi:hypothetical protein
LTVDGSTVIAWRDDGVAEIWSKRALLSVSDRHGVVTAFVNTLRRRLMSQLRRCHAPGAIWKLWRWCRKSEKSWQDSSAAWRGCHAPGRRRNRPIMQANVVFFVADDERCHAPGETSFASK